MNKTLSEHPPTEVELESLYFRFIELLRDYNYATADWKQFLVEELTEVYNQTLSFSVVKNVERNPYYRLITHRSLEEHLILIKPKHNVL